MSRDILLDQASLELQLWVAYDMALKRSNSPKCFAIVMRCLFRERAGQKYSQKRRDL